MPLNIKPYHLRAARDYVGRYHRHSVPPMSGKFSGACYDGNHLCGIATCGRPVARHLDGGLILEVPRCCTEETDNACSKLYSACCRIGFFMGYGCITTYTLASKVGASLWVAGFTFDGIAGSRAWTGLRRRNYCVAPAERKHRWIKRRVGMMP